MKYKYNIMKIHIHLPIVLHPDYMLYLAIIGLHFFVSSYYVTPNQLVVSHPPLITACMYFR